MFELHLDYILFVACSLGGLWLLHYWIRRTRGEGVHRNVWILLIVGLIGGLLLVNRAGKIERASLRRMVEGFAPTYAIEMERLGHEKITLDTDEHDPLYRSMIEAEINWLAVNPAVADVYTFKKRADGVIVMMVDSETDYDHNGVYEGDRESRTKIPVERSGFYRIDYFEQMLRRELLNRTQR